MSDELIKSLNARISELEKAKANLEVALRGERKDRKAVRAELDELLARADSEFGEADALREALEAERDEWQQKATAAPSELAAELEALKGTLRARDHGDAWKDAVGGELHEKATIEKLWGEVGYKPEGEKPTPEQITEWVGRAREAAPYLFVPPAADGNSAPRAQRPPLKAAEAPSRGARDSASGTVRISKSEMRTPGWMSKDKAKAAAFLSGEFVQTDD